MLGFLETFFSVDKDEEQNIQSFSETPAKPTKAKDLTETEDEVQQIHKQTEDEDKEYREEHTPEDDDQQHVYMLQPHMAAKCVIAKYPDYDSAILACEQDMAIGNAIGSMFERNVKQKSMFEMLKDKMLKHLNEAKPYITIYEPLDTDLYKGRPALREFCERVIKVYCSLCYTDESYSSK